MTSRLRCRPHASAARVRASAGVDGRRPARGGVSAGGGRGPRRSRRPVLTPRNRRGGEAIGFRRRGDHVERDQSCDGVLVEQSARAHFEPHAPLRLGGRRRGCRGRRPWTALEAVGALEAAALAAAAGRDASMALSARPASPASFVSRMTCQSCCSSSAMVRPSAATRSAAAGVVVSAVDGQGGRAFHCRDQRQAIPVATAATTITISFSGGWRSARGPSRASRPGLCPAATPDAISSVTINLTAFSLNSGTPS